jgi:hypothetical protein
VLLAELLVFFKSIGVGGVGGEIVLFFGIVFEVEEFFVDGLFTIERGFGEVFVAVVF